MPPHRATRLGVACIVTALAVAPLRAAAGDALVERFERTARADGGRHAAGFDALLAEGDALLTLCEERVRAADVRERQLARALLLERREPARVAAWRAALDRTDVAVMPVADAPGRARFLAYPGEAEVVAFGAEAAPWFDEQIRGAALGGVRPFHATRVLALVGDADCAPTLARTLDIDDVAVDGLRRLGAAALPVLRGFVAGDARCGAAQDASAPAERVRVARAATLLSEAGDADATPALRAALARTDLDAPDEVATALATLHAVAAAPDIATRAAARLSAALRARNERRVDVWALANALVALGEAGESAADDVAHASGELPARVLADAVRECCALGPELAATYALVAADDDTLPDATEPAAEVGRREFEYGRDVTDEFARRVPALLSLRALALRSAADARLVLDADAARGAPVAAALATAGSARSASELVLALAVHGRPETVAVVDALLAREVWREPQWLVEALLLLGGDDARAALARIRAATPATRPYDHAEFVAAAALAAEFDDTSLATFRARLRDGSPGVRAVAARVLAVRSPDDVDAVVAVLLGDCGHDAESRRPDGWRHRDLILGLGARALPALDTAADDTSDAARIAAGLAARLRDLDFAARVDVALRDAEHVYRYHVVRERMVASAAARLAAQVGDAALPLLDEAALACGRPLAGHAAAILRGGATSSPEAPPRAPPSAPSGDVEAALRAVAEGHGKSSAAFDLCRALGEAAAAERVLAVARAADGDAARRLHALRLAAVIVWNVRGPERDPEQQLAAPRAETERHLIALIGAADPAASRWAAGVLMQPDSGADAARLADALTQWMRADERVPRFVLFWLGRRGVTEATERALALYRAEHYGPAEIAEFLGDVRYAPASDALWTVAELWLRERPGYHSRLAELDALARIGGAANVAHMLEIYRRDAPVALRMQAAECLARMGDARIRDELAAEFRRLVADDAAHGAEAPGAPRGADIVGVYRPALALLLMDADDGARVVYDVLLRTESPRTSQAILAAIATYRREHPEFVPPRVE